MKIRITILAILLILMIFVGLRKEQDPLHRLLKKEFDTIAWLSYTTRIEGLESYLLNFAPNVRNEPLFEEEMPTWRKLILDLYAKPNLAEDQPYIYASKLLRKNLKSRHKGKFMTSIYLSYFKPDTGEVRCIEEYMNKETDEEKKRALFFISREIRKRFYKMQYGLMEDIGLHIILPRMFFLERPPEADFYMSIYISKNGMVSFGDRLFSYNNLPKVIENTTKYEKNRSFCFFFHADRALEWEFMWEVLGPLIELSERSSANIEFFFPGRRDFDSEFEPEPYELGLKFKKENTPLKNTDIDIHMDGKGYLLVNGKEQTLKDLESLPLNKNIKFTFKKSSPIKYFLIILSLIKKSNPNDYYYVVE